MGILDLLILSTELKRKRYRKRKDERIEEIFHAIFQYNLGYFSQES